MAYDNDDEDGLWSSYNRHVYRVVHRYATANLHWNPGTAYLKTLQDLNAANAKRESMREHGGYFKYEYKLVPVEDIDLPPVWRASKKDPLRERMDKGLPIDPIRGVFVSGKLQIEDGIHRTHVAIEKGYPQIPAIVKEWIDTPRYKVAPAPQKHRLDVGAWVRIFTPVREGADIYRFGWVSEQLPLMGLRWRYQIALVNEKSDWPELLDLNDDAFQPSSAPAWGAEVRKKIGL